VLAMGIVAEVAVALVLAGRRLRESLLVPARGLGPALGLGAAAGQAPRLAALLLAVLAATQLAAPLNPVPAVERNLLVAAVALAAVMWLGWARSWEANGARLALLVQCCWLVALLAPALLSESVRPQALGGVVVPVQLPLKVAAGLLALLCLPAQLPLPTARVADGAGGPDEQLVLSRLLLWLPLCGLIVSLFVPPAPDDPAGAARFLACTAAAAAAAIGMAYLAQRRPLSRLYPRVLVLLALAVLLIGGVTSLLT